MPCLNSVDLIATPGRRLMKIFQAATGLDLRTKLAEYLPQIGWSVERRDVTTGPSPGIGWIATSAPSPWCVRGEAPAEYVGRCRVWFYPISTFNSGAAPLTEFKVMNQAETMVQGSSSIHLWPTSGTYAKYSYILLATPYDFKLLMLGVQDRVALSIDNQRTAIFCGVPQIPSFLQARGEWCKGGVDEMFYCVDASSMRTGGSYKDSGFFAAGVKSSSGTFMNTNSGGFPVESRFAWMLSNGTGQQDSTQDAMWVQETAAAPALWHPFIYPAIAVWARDPSDPSNTRRMMGFLWDAILINKALPGDALVRLDGKTFLVVNHNWAGGLSPYRPPSTLAIRTE